MDLSYMQKFKQKWTLKIRDTFVQAHTNLHFLQNWTPTVSLRGNFALMEYLHNPGFSQTELAQLKRCRIHLQVNMLSKICNVVGSQVMLHALTGQISRG